jgi:endonuclease-3
MSSLKSQSKIPPHLDEALRRLDRAYPDPRCELFYLTPYQLLVSVVLSAQTTDKMVNRCMEPVYRAGFTPELALKWGEGKLLEKIRSIGLAPTKAKNVIKLSQRLIDQHGGQVPNHREALEDLPGVGRKTANVILGELFGEPTLAVDTHVFRVTARLGFHQEKTPEKAEQALLKILPKNVLPKAHHWFILHGRYVCKAQSPQCVSCPLNDICPSSQVTHALATKRPKQRQERQADNRR